MHTTRVRRQDVVSKPGISFLSESELEAVHDASLRVLEKTGIKVMSKTALDILKKAGAKVKGDSGHVIIPRNLVEEALEMAPKTVKYYARNPKNDLELSGQRSHFCASGGPPFMLDIETGERRYSTSEDIARCATIADYLDHVHLIYSLGTGSDVPPPMRYIVDMYTSLRNCEKHFEGDSTTAKEARYQIEIASAIVGGREELRKRPIISFVICPMSPLTYDKGMTEAGIELGRAGIPVVVYPMPTMGGTSPATPAGTVVIINAEVLGGLVIQEFATPGAPVVYGGGVGTIDFKKGSIVRSPERNLMEHALNQLARYYGLPNEMSATGGTTSKTLDMQAGYERAISTLPQVMTTPDIVLGTGSLGGSRIMSAEALVIDNEIIDYALRYIEGFEVNDDTLAVDIIDKVGPAKVFLGEKHTVQNFRDRWAPRLSDISTFEVWEEKGSKAIDELAREKVREILATHKAAPLSEDIEQEIGRILKRAEAELL